MQTQFRFCRSAAFLECKPARDKALKLRSICRLFAKELVVKNFAGSAPPELLERLIQLSLYTEENLR